MQVKEWRLQEAGVLDSGTIQTREWLLMNHSIYHQIQLLNVAKYTQYIHREQKREDDRRPNRSPKPRVRHRQRHKIIEHAKLPPLHALRLDNNAKSLEAVKLREIRGGGLGDVPVLPVSEL